MIPKSIKILDVNKFKELNEKFVLIKQINRHFSSPYDSDNFITGELGICSGKGNENGHQSLFLGLRKPAIYQLYSHSNVEENKKTMEKNKIIPLSSFNNNETYFYFGKDAQKELEKILPFF